MKVQWKERVMSLEGLTCFQLQLNSSNALIFSFPFISFGSILPSYNFMDIRKINKLAFSKSFNFKLKIISDCTVFYFCVSVSTLKGELCTREQK